MSNPLFQQLSPPFPITQQAYSTHVDNGSLVPVIAVVSVITILGVVAGLIGRLCTGHRVLGLDPYDFDAWVEAKCSSCVDGSPASPPPPPPPSPPPEPHTILEPPPEIHLEMKEEPMQNPYHAHSDN